MIADPSIRPVATVFVTGPITLGEVSRWREDFADGLARFTGLRLDLGSSGPWDLAGVQLVLSLKLSCENTDRTIRLTNVPGVFLSIAERAGLLDRFSPCFEGPVA